MKLEKNMGAADRIIRLLIAAVIAVLILSDRLSGTAAVILGILAVIFIITAIVGFCPLYTLFGRKGRGTS